MCGGDCRGGCFPPERIRGGKLGRHRAAQTGVANSLGAEERSLYTRAIARQTMRMPFGVVVAVPGGKYG